mmetsp:Transcript_37577/g.45368  ORF Transcript_37577/g.45368 Transcript_37577/m.45368 type:complete len:101 (-) Transcript_37577:532-834(-)
MCTLDSRERHVFRRTKVCTGALDAELISEYQKQNLNFNAEYKNNSLNMKNNILAIGWGYCDPLLICLKMLVKKSRKGMRSYLVNRSSTHRVTNFVASKRL